MNLPTAWEQAGIPELPSSMAWSGSARSSTCPPERKAKRANCISARLMIVDTTWVNGTPIGGMDEYNLDRVYEIPAGVLKPGKNSIAVRVLDTGGAGGVYGKPEQMFVEVPGGDNIRSGGRWKYKIGVPLAKTTRRADQMSATIPMCRPCCTTA